MFCKLAISNFKKSTKEFLIYFLTLAFGICLFYTFNSIEAQQAMLQITKSQKDLVKVLVEMISYISIFISVILAFLILYTNKFLIKRRKKEFGIYMTLGMEKKDISKILILETFLIGVVALIVGLIVGVFLSQGLSVLTAKFFETDLNSLKFIFSIVALKKSILYFSIIFLIVMIFNVISISRYKLIDLIYANKKSEKLRFKKLWIPMIIFIASIGVLGLAYYRILEYGLMNFDSKLLITVILGAVGTFLFFMSLAGFVLKLITLNKRLYYKNLNIFILRQINSKVNTNFVSMTMVCLMLFITISMLAGGATFAYIFSNDIKAANPYDISARIGSENTEPSNEVNLKSQEALNKLKNNFTNLEEFKLYNLETIKYKNILAGIEPNKEKNFEYIKEAKVDIIKISDLNKLLKMQGKEELKLENNKYYIVCSIESVKKYFENYLIKNDTLIVNNKELKPYQNKTIEVVFQDNMAKEDTALIVPDEVLNNLEPTVSLININYTNGDVNKNNELVKSLISEIGTETMYTNVTSRSLMYEQSMSLKVMIIYIAIYIGIIFLITSAAVLAIQQLTESSDNVERYALLKKIGVEQSMINRSIFIQICIYFLVPLSLAIVHSIVGIVVLNDTISILGQTNMFVNICITGGTIVLIYGGYLIATYFGAKNIINND